MSTTLIPILSRNDSTTEFPDDSGDYYVDIDGPAGGIPGGHSTIIVLVVVGLLTVGTMICAVLKMYQRRNGIRLGYSAAIQNRHFKEGKTELDCLNCRLIEMGSMACYTETCEQCGRVPPNRQPV